MHREIQIKQFPIVTTHWWPKTRNERFVWENQQYLYRFLPLVHNHVQVIWVRTRIRCVTCVCARSGSRCIHTGRRRQRLTEGVSEACCWRAFIVTNNQSHTSLVLHERDWVFAWGDLIGWRLRWRLKSCVSTTLVVTVCFRWVLDPFTNSKQFALSSCNIVTQQTFVHCWTKP